MEYDCDVAVVGGGPGGVITAIQVARAGYKCVLLDKKPRDKIGDKNCGDALDQFHSDLLKEDMGIEPPSLEKGEARDLIRYITIAAEDLDTKFSAKAPGYQVDRLVYGQRLLREAEEAGVDVRPNSPVRGILQEGNHITGIKYFDENRKQHELRAKITVDASGFIGVVRKEIPEELRMGVDLSIPDEYAIGTYREIIDLHQEKDHPHRQEIILFYHDEIPPPGYAWIFTEGEKKLNIGITWSKHDPYPENKSMKKIFHEILDPYLPPETYTVTNTGGGNIPMRPNFDTLVFNGAMLVGDAAAMADPTTFEGHGPALESGRLAGKVAVKALEKGSYTAEDMWEYNKLVNGHLGKIHAQTFLAARFMRDVGIDKIAFLFRKKILDQEELEGVFERGETFSLWYAVKKFLLAFPRWGFLIKLKFKVDHVNRTAKVYDDYPTDPSKLSEWRARRNKVMGFSF